MNGCCSIIDILFIEGIKNHCLFALFKEDLEVGRKYWANNVEPIVRRQTHSFNETLVDMLGQGKENILSKSR